MGRRDKIRLPSTGAGLTSYLEDYKTNIEFKPAHVIVMIIVVIIVILLLQYFGRGILG